MEHFNLSWEHLSFCFFFFFSVRLLCRNKQKRLDCCWVSKRRKHLLLGSLALRNTGIQEPPRKKNSRTTGPQRAGSPGDTSHRNVGAVVHATASQCTLLWWCYLLFLSAGFPALGIFLSSFYLLVQFCLPNITWTYWTFGSLQTHYYPPASHYLMDFLLYSVNHLHLLYLHVRCMWLRPWQSPQEQRFLCHTFQ